MIRTKAKQATNHSVGRGNPTTERATPTNKALKYKERYGKNNIESNQIPRFWILKCSLYHNVNRVDVL
jgi:hypothetical protein